MEDVFFGVSDGVSESCFSSTLDDFLPDWESSWFCLGNEKKVKCNKSPSHESDSGLSSQISLSEVGSPLPDENNIINMSECEESGKFIGFTETNDLIDSDSDLLSFLMNSDEENTSEMTCAEQILQSSKDGAAVNTDENDNRVGYNSRKSKTSCSSHESVQQLPNSSAALKQSENILCTPAATKHTKTASVKMVRLVTPVLPGKAVTVGDVTKAIEVKNKKNAQNAKMNREKKKMYIQGLEEQVDGLKKENHSLKEEKNALKNEKTALLEEVDYLKSVLANESSLSALLKNIPSVKTVSLSTSLSNKRSAQEDRDYVGIAKKRRKAGVCLHVEGPNVSLEFCSHCAKMASKSSGIDK